MSRILHKIEEKLHIHHKHGDDDIHVTQNKPEEPHVINEEINVDKKEEVVDHKKRNMVKKIAGKIAKKLVHAHHRTPREEGEEEEEEGEEVEGEGESEGEGEGGCFGFELDFDF
ncbi:hypothetical protein MTR67_008551 [Solanum verrucosum]|uniref:Uncharacterized protein n=1 Tax=Solanum verrucosum TaxID=315347 RepID=A0AAF0Q1T9_SOLVR|nr:hypothetical protein MTR67_008551 [Solanum verrucosum]